MISRSYDVIEFIPEIPNINFQNHFRTLLNIFSDHKSAAESGFDLMRPYLHEFLTSAYENFDIVIWCRYY